MTLADALARENGFNPRYVDYARAHGKTPVEMLEVDRIAWPGGQMAGFLIWSRQRLGEARKAIPSAFVAGGGLWDHATYDEWLSRRVDDLLTERTP